MKFHILSVHAKATDEKQTGYNLKSHELLACCLSLLLEEKPSGPILFGVGYPLSNLNYNKFHELLTEDIFLNVSLKIDLFL